MKKCFEYINRYEIVIDILQKRILHNNSCVEYALEASHANEQEINYVNAFVEYSFNELIDPIIKSIEDLKTYLNTSDDSDEVKKHEVMIYFKKEAENLKHSLQYYKFIIDRRFRPERLLEYNEDYSDEEFSKRQQWASKKKPIKLTHPIETSPLYANINCKTREYAMITYLNKHGELLMTAAGIAYRMSYN